MQMAPPSWQLEPANRFRSYQSQDANHHELRAYLLLQLTDTGKAEDHYRIHVEGSEPLEAEFGGGDVSRKKEIKNFVFNVEIRPDDLDLRRNCMATAWGDLHEAVEEGRIGVALPGEADPAAAFRRTWAAITEADPDMGAAIRWAVVGTDSGLKLELQALPAPAHCINRDPRLSNNACPAISLASFGLQIDMTPEGPLHGPKPILFARHLDRVQERLKQEPLRPAAGNLKQNR